ncbi:MAG: ABC transporter permease [Gaiellaceae bacterium MAG52_C11]|nr:ABC transporter permease [Candidatus Gaiellasilicea maunaloa]
MSTLQYSGPGRLSLIRLELGKLSAFLRRDLLIAWSYRLAFVSEWSGLALQAVMFYFVGRLVDPSVLPTYGGSETTYMEFAAVGIAMTAFVQLALSRVGTGLRAEQVQGTLESLLMTPTSPSTIQIGTVFYDLLYIPLRTAVFLVLTAVAFGLHFDTDGFLPALTVLLAFIPFVWGLGVANAGFILTFRRGGGISGLVVTVLTLFSGAFFPLELLPEWGRDSARLNPIAIAIDGMRQPLLGGSGWSGVGGELLVLLPLSALSLAVGLLAFRAALRREKRRGSLGLY